jgi:hypothetical protein
MECIYIKRTGRSEIQKFTLLNAQDVTPLRPGGNSHDNFKKCLNIWTGSALSEFHH